MRIVTGNPYSSISEDVLVSRLKDIIKPGDIIGIKASPESEWINDIVEGIIPESDIIELRLKEDFIDKDVMVGDEIECRFAQGDVVYIMNGIIRDIGINLPLIIMAEINKISKFDNTRNSKRYTTNLCGRIIFDNNEKSTFATIKNISRTGISVTCREYIENNEEVDVDIVLWKEEVLSIEGRVVRAYKIGRNYKYGIIIENMDKRSRELLVELIEEMEELEEKERKINKR